MFTRILILVLVLVPVAIIGYVYYLGLDPFVKMIGLTWTDAGATVFAILLLAAFFSWVSGWRRKHFP